MFATLLLLSAQLAAAEPDRYLTLSSDPQAPPGVAAGFGRLVGSWRCDGTTLQQDGSWKTDPPGAHWDFYYALEGHAVQDVWYPPAASKGGVGTNLRTYDPETDQWQMVWATSDQPRFDHFTAKVQDGNIVMHGDRWARPAFGAHSARITFHNISADHFDWRYEATADASAEDAAWREVTRLACQRVD